MTSKLRHVLIIGTLTSVACYGKCLGEIGSGPTPVPTPPVIVVQATPTPPPTPTLDDPCVPTRMVLKFHSSPESDTVIAPGASRQLDATPMRGEVEIADSCNRDRFPDWKVETIASTLGAPQCSLVNATRSYIPNLIAPRTSGNRCRITATLTVAVIEKDGIVTKTFPAVFEVEVR